MDEFEIKTRQLCDFIAKSPSCYHVIENAKQLLEEKGFTEIFENTAWSLAPGRSYFVTRNGSSIIAFKVPENKPENFQVIASHSDSPAFKIKENPEIPKAGHYVELNVEKYGGMLCLPWFDRPLSIAGRAAVRKDGRIETRLIDFGRDLVMIPSLAIHMNRQANENISLKIQNDMLPLFGDGEASGKFMEELSTLAGVSAEDIPGYDLFLYVRNQASFWGASNEYFSSPKLDNLQNAFSSLQAVSEAENNSSILICAIFDNEEVGSQSLQGAGSTFLSDTLERLCSALEIGRSEYLMMAAKSFMLSADNGHAVHPNNESKADPVNRPVMNGGVVLKFNSAMKYTTDGVSAAVFRSICEKAGVPTQVYVNNSDIAGGSTLGNIALSHIPFAAVDIGCAQLAMHSPYETGGVKDTLYMTKAMTAFYTSKISKNETGQFLLG